MMNNITKQEIDSIFKAASCQSDYLLALYEKAIPDFENVCKVQIFPVVSKATSEYLFSKAIDFDSEHHPGVLPGGCWMNSGFGISDKLDDWFVEMDETGLVYKSDPIETAP